jgi:hypothetical protein
LVQTTVELLHHRFYDYGNESGDNDITIGSSDRFSAYSMQLAFVAEYQPHAQL